MAFSVGAVPQTVRVGRILITRECPLGCPVCPFANGLSPSRDDVISAIRTAAGLGAEAVAIGGGEPLYRLDLLRAAISEARDLGLLVSITTSGYGARRSEARRLLESVDAVQVSVGWGRVTLWDEVSAFRRGEIGVDWGVNFLLPPNPFSAWADLLGILGWGRRTILITAKSDRGMITDPLAASELAAALAAEFGDLVLADCVIGRLQRGGVCENDGVTIDAVARRVSWCGWADGPGGCPLLKGRVKFISGGRILTSGP